MTIPTMLVILDAGVRTLVFLSFVHASFFHFRREKPEPLGMLLIKFTSVAAFMVNIGLTLLSSHAAAAPLTILDIVFTCAAAGVFLAAKHASKRGNLHVAYSDEKSGALLQHGIFARLRHPFYCSYLLYWWSWVLSTTHFASIAFATLLTAQYLVSIRKEERLLIGKFGKEFISYKKRTPAIIPHPTLPRK